MSLFSAPRATDTLPQPALLSAAGLISSALLRPPTDGKVLSPRGGGRFANLRVIGGGDGDSDGGAAERN